MKVLPTALREIVAGLILERRLGAALIAAGPLPPLTVRWTFIGALESTWFVDFADRCVRHVDEPESLTCPVSVTWFLDCTRAAACLRGRYRLSDGARDGTLNVTGTRVDRLRFARAMDALGRGDLSEFYTDRNAFLARRGRRRSVESRRPMVGVRLRSTTSGH